MFVKNWVSSLYYGPTDESAPMAINDADKHLKTFVDLYKESVDEELDAELFGYRVAGLANLYNEIFSQCVMNHQLDKIIAFREELYSYSIVASCPEQANKITRVLFGMPAAIIATRELGILVEQEGYKEQCADSGVVTEWQLQRALNDMARTKIGFEDLEAVLEPEFTEEERALLEPRGGFEKVLVDSGVKDIDFNMRVAIIRRQIKLALESEVIHITPVPEGAMPEGAVPEGSVEEGLSEESITERFDLLVAHIDAMPLEKQEVTQALLNYFVQVRIREEMSPCKSNEELFKAWKLPTPERESKAAIWGSEYSRYGKGIIAQYTGIESSRDWNILVDRIVQIANESSRVDAT